MSKLGIYIEAILTPILLGILIGIITTPYMDYSIIQKPYSPPGFVFPIVWTILYILMGVSYAILDEKKLTNNKINLIYYIQLFVNLLWSVFFFLLKWRLFSFFWILLLIILVTIMIKEFYNKNKLSGLLQIPYLLWISFAAYLNFAIYLLNR